MGEWFVLTGGGKYLSCQEEIEEDPQEEVSKQDRSW